MVCSNHMNLQDDVNQVVIHELIHAYDDCRAANLDWANCAHHACSEVVVIVNNRLLLINVYLCLFSNLFPLSHLCLYGTDSCWPFKW